MGSSPIEQQNWKILEGLRVDAKASRAVHRKV